MQVTYYGHSCFGIDTGSVKLLIDPFITPNTLASHINIDEIQTDVVLISHGHEDHLADAEDILKRTGAKLVTNFEIHNWYSAKGIDNIAAVNHGGSTQHGDVSIKYVNAIHSSTLPDGTDGGNPGGFIISAGGKTVHHAGDTALTMDMQLLGQYENINLAILPIGDVFTMGVDDAVIAAGMLKCDNVVGMHYDTFPPIEIDKEAALEKFSSAGKSLTLMNIGSSITI